MPMATHFHQQCPVCGRTVRISVEHLGIIVQCRHCRGQFEACDAADSQQAMVASQDTDRQRIDELLFDY